MEPLSFSIHMFFSRFNGCLTCMKMKQILLADRDTQMETSQAAPVGPTETDCNGGAALLPPDCLRPHRGLGQPQPGASSGMSLSPPDWQNPTSRSPVKSTMCSPQKKRLPLCSQPRKPRTRHRPKRQPITCHPPCDTERGSQNCQSQFQYGARDWASAPRRDDWIAAWPFLLDGNTN